MCPVEGLVGGDAFSADVEQGESLRAMLLAVVGIPFIYGPVRKGFPIFPVLHVPLRVHGGSDDRLPAPDCEVGLVKGSAAEYVIASEVVFFLEIDFGPVA